MNREEAIKIIEELEVAKTIINKHYPKNVVAVDHNYLQLPKKFMVFADSYPEIKDTGTYSDVHNHWKYTINGINVVSLTQREEE